MFAPVVENPNETAIITNKPINLITSGQFNKVPTIFGYTSAEGLYCVIDQKVQESRGEILSVNFPKLEDLVPSSIKHKKSPETIQKLFDKVTNIYQNDEHHVEVGI